MIEFKTLPDTGNEELYIGEIENCLRIRYIKRDNTLNAVANTMAGYLSVTLEKTIVVKPAPWSEGVFLVSGDAQLSIEKSVYDQVAEWLEAHGVQNRNWMTLTLMKPVTIHTHTVRLA